jgi:hypothetical protein
MAGGEGDVIVADEFDDYLESESVLEAGDELEAGDVLEAGMVATGPVPKSDDALQAQESDDE